ncbi:MAG: hypothetical protein AMXMBFR36_17770 [Acidobacteriota bacterium]
MVMPVRNGVTRLAESAASVLSEFDVDLELVVVDDGSTDGTPELLRDLASGDSRIRVHLRSREGITNALRFGCAQARSELIARQDVGDLSIGGRFERQVERLAAEPRLVLVSCWTECFAPDGEPLYVLRGDAPPDRSVEIVHADSSRWRHVGPTSHGSAAFRRGAYEAVGGYRSEFRLGQDWDLWLRLADRGLFHTIGSVHYLRWMDPGSVSYVWGDLQEAFGALSLQAARLRRSGESDERQLEAARSLGRRLDLGASSRRIRLALSRANYHAGEVLRRRSDPAAVKYLRRAVGSAPTSPKSWIRLVQALLDSHRPVSDSDGR